MARAAKNKKEGSVMTNYNDNRERKNKYPNNKDQAAMNGGTIRSEMTKKDRKK
jgi:hypothetical protein